MIDWVVVIFVIAVFRDHIFTFLDDAIFNNRLSFVLAVVVYFALFWSSPFSASPGQLLLGIRVVDAAGTRLPPSRAVLRAGAMVCLIVFALVALWSPYNSWLIPVSLVALCLALLAGMTRRQQGLHDLVASSFVVKRSTLIDEESRHRLRAALSDEGPTRLRRPSTMRVAIDALVLGSVALAAHNLSTMMRDRDIIYRTNYAVNQTSPLRNAVSAFAKFERRWPNGQEELGLGRRERYPAGGYFELNDNGEIHIRFEVVAELAQRTIVLRPRLEAGEVEWYCDADPSIRFQHLPPVCRTDSAMNI